MLINIFSLTFFKCWTKQNTARSSRVQRPVSSHWGATTSLARQVRRRGAAELGERPHGVLLLGLGENNGGVRGGGAGEARRRHRARTWVAAVGRGWREEGEVLDFGFHWPLCALDGFINDYVSFFRKIYTELLLLPMKCTYRYSRRRCRDCLGSPRCSCRRTRVHWRTPCSHCWC